MAAHHPAFINHFILCLQDLPDRQLADRELKARVIQWALPDKVCYVPVGFQGQGSFHLHAFLRCNSYFILRRENIESSH